MSKLVDEIKFVVENEYLEELCGFQYNNYISFSIEVNDISRDKDVCEAFKDYVLENDCYLSKNTNTNVYNVTKEELDKYELEEIKYYADDLYILFGFVGTIDSLKLERLLRLIDLLMKNNVKAYRLINPLVNNGYVHEYLFLKDDIIGTIRCYETKNERFIISFNGCD